MSQNNQHIEDTLIEEQPDEVVAEELDMADETGDETVEADHMTEEETVTSTDDAADGEEVAEEELVMTLDDVRLIEAMLFASSSALSESQMAERFPPARVKLIPDILDHLRESYANRGVNLVQRDRRWALRTATDLADSLRLEKEQPKKFTRAAMETMAVVAYHQPVTRAEIENIRGVATSPGALDALMEAGWIKPGKRREVPGRPVTWLSTQAFLDHFGLEKLTDLPGMDDLKAAGLLDKRPAIEAMPTADMFDGEDTRNDAEDPQDVTDEDLIGKSALTEEGAEGDVEDADADVENDDAFDDEGEDDDFDDEDAEDDDSDDEDHDDASDEDEDLGDDDDASDDEDSDDGEEPEDDEDDEDEDDDDFDDEDDEEDDR